MNLYTWSGFPNFPNSKAFALANSIEEAREILLNNLSKSQAYDPVREIIVNRYPTIYEQPHGWLQEVGPQHI